MARKEKACGEREEELARKERERREEEDDMEFWKGVASGK